MKKLLFLIFLVGWASKTCTAYEKLVIVAAHAVIPLALYAGNALMIHLGCKPQISVLSSNMENFENKVRVGYGTDGLTLVQQVMYSIRLRAPHATYEYQKFYNQPAQLIIHHNDAKNWHEIHNQSYNRNDCWRLIPNEALSNHQKTVIQFQPITMEDREREGYDFQIKNPEFIDYSCGGFLS